MKITDIIDIQRINGNIIFKTNQNHDFSFPIATYEPKQLIYAMERHSINQEKELVNTIKFEKIQKEHREGKK